MALFEEKKIQKKSNLTINQRSIFDEKNMYQEKEKKAKKIKVKSSFSDIAPIIDITANGYFQLSNDTGYMEIVQLTSKDIYSLNNADKDKDIYSFAYFLQWYLNDIKIIPLNFPVDTSSQQRHLLKRLEREHRSEYRFFLEQKLKELEFIETERTNREYYMFLYAEDEYTLHSRINHVERLLAVVLPIVRLSDEKKINILYKLNNLNSKNKTAKGDY